MVKLSTDCLHILHRTQITNECTATEAVNRIDFFNLKTWGKLQNKLINLYEYMIKSASKQTWIDSVSKSSVYDALSCFKTQVLPIFSKTAFIFGKLTFSAYQPFYSTKYYKTNCTKNIIMKSSLNKCLRPESICRHFENRTNPPLWSTNR